MWRLLRKEKKKKMMMKKELSHHRHLPFSLHCTHSSLFFHKRYMAVVGLMMIKLMMMLRLMLTKMIAIGIGSAVYACGIRRGRVGLW